MSEFGAFMLMVAAILCLLALIKFLAWLTELQERGGIGAAIRQSADRYVVKRSAQPLPFVMSREEEPPSRLARPSLETRPSQTQDQTEDAGKRRQKLLDTYTPLKHLGMSRDDARTLLKIWDIPLDNNLWAQVPAKEETPYTTPIAGRATAAQFETEPDLRYQPPPR